MNAPTPPRRIRRGALAGAAAVLVGACSGVGTSDLFTPGATATRDSGASPSGPDDGGPPQPGVADGSVPPNAVDASPVRDAVVDVAPPPSDSAVERIDCQGSTCTVGAQTCCRRGSAAPYSYGCEAAPPSGCTATSAADKPLAVVCDDAHDCAALGKPQTVCCGDYVLDAQSRPNVTNVGCVAPALCLRPQSRVVLCGDGDGAVCPVATHCDVSQTALPGFRICVSD